jgi:hypothetical protein
MKTVNEVITRFRRHYPGCDSTTALDLFQTAYRRLLDKAQFRMADVEFASIVSGTREYAWSEDDLRVYAVTWYKSATSFWPLRPTSEDELRDQGPAWKESTATGEPTAFYVAARTDASANKTGKLVLGFDATPNETTATGYPKAVCHCEQVEGLTGTDQLPFSVLDEMYFVYAMCEFWAYEEDVQKAPLWERKRIQEESIQIEHLKKLIPMQETVLLPPAGVFSKRVR